MEDWPRTRPQNTVGECGILYCAYSRKYIDIAAQSVSTLQQHTTVPCCIFTAVPRYAAKLEVFDHVFDLGYQDAIERYFVAPERLPSLKLLSLLQSPFEKTLHLDSDTLVLGDISHVFDALEHHDLLLTNDSESNYEMDASSGRRIHRELVRFTNPEAFNTGVLAYLNSPETTAFLNAWNDDFIASSQKHPDTGNWTNVNDQVSLTRLIKNRVPAKLGLSWSILPNVEYNVTGRMIPEMARANKLKQAKIIHTIFAHNWVRQGNSIDSIADDPSLKQFAGNMD